MVDSKTGETFESRNPADRDDIVVELQQSGDAPGWRDGSDPEGGPIRVPSAIDDVSYGRGWFSFEAPCIWRVPWIAGRYRDS